jgi:hypothetical protein
MSIDTSSATSPANELVLEVSPTYSVGTRVEVRFKGGKRFFSGKVKAINTNGTHTILYDDGDTEFNVPSNLMRIPSRAPTQEEAQPLPVSPTNDRPQMRSVYVAPVRELHSESESDDATQVTQPLAVALANRMTFREVSNILNTSYNYEQAIQSTTLDIIGVYLKGQKVLYTEAKTYCEMNLYMLMLPTIAISAICTLLSTELKATSYGPTTVSCLAAINSFLLSLVTYLKLDAKAEAHKTSAYSFEKLQARCEFTSGKILFLTNTAAPQADPQSDPRTGHVPENRYASFNSAAPVMPPQQELVTATASTPSIFTPTEVLREIESKIMEIKDNNCFLLPEAIRYKFPVLTSTNIFTEVKRLQNREIILINELKTVINKQQETDQRLAQNRDPATHDLLVKQQEELSQIQNQIFAKVISYRDEYLQIDKKFHDEIQKNIRHWSNTWCICFRWLKT